MKKELMPKITIDATAVKEFFNSLPDEFMNKWGGPLAVSGIAYLTLWQILDSQKSNKAMDNGYSYESSPFGVKITQPNVVTS